MSFLGFPVILRCAWLDFQNVHFILFYRCNGIKVMFGNQIFKENIIAFRKKVTKVWCLICESYDLDPLKPHYEDSHQDDTTTAASWGYEDDTSTAASWEYEDETDWV